MKSTGALFFLVTIAFAPVQPVAAQEGLVRTTLYVAPSSLGGSDSHSGTIDEPFLTLKRAQQAVRDVDNDKIGDIIVYVRGGIYELEEPLIFLPHDSGKSGYRVSYMAYPGEKPVITGGRRISGWIAAGNGLYKADTNGLRFRQLYVNGQPGTRARTPNEGSFNRLRRWDEAGRTIVVTGSEISNLQELNGVEMVIHKEWTQNNLRLASYALSDSEAHLVPVEPDRTKAFSIRENPKKNGQSYYLENAYQFLDAEGEWYLRIASSEVFYKPRAEEDVSTMVAVVPKLVQLVRLQGTPDAPVTGIDFNGMTFEHSTWLEPSEEGFASRYSDFIYKSNANAYAIPGAIHLEYAEGIRFEQNVFRNLGATAIVLWSGVHGSSFIRNTFRNISASGISIGMDLIDHPPDSHQICRRNVIKNNYITQVGRDYHSSVGIFSGYTERIVIENNELAHMPYTGIAVGWGSTSRNTALRNNLIRRNRVHHVMNLLADGAGIYTVSKQPGTAIVENYVFGIVRSPWAGEAPISGIYLDDRSSQITVANNLLENVPIGIVLHQAEYNTVINNRASFQGIGGSSYNDFIREGHIDPDAIRANAGVERANDTAAPATSLNP